MRRFVVGFVLLCLCAFSISAGIFYTPVLASTGGHGCASPVPPGVPGSPAPAPAAPGIIVINEVLLAPHSTWNCSETSGTYFAASDSWIEFYNTQNDPYNLYTAHATIDSGPNTNPYYFPFAASIAAHGYLVVFPYVNGSFSATKTSAFRLLISNVVIDQVTVPALGPDQSYARTSDGAPTWEITSTPTIDASNTSLITPTAAGALPGTPSATQAIASGTQPAWNKLLMPTPTSQLVLAASPATVATASSQANSTGPTASSSLTLSQQIILTLLIIALGVTLSLGWRVFGPPKERKTKS